MRMEEMRSEKIFSSFKKAGLCLVFTLPSFLSSCKTNQRKNIFRVGTFSGYKEKDGTILEEEISYSLVVKRIEKSVFQDASGINVLFDSVTSQRPNYLSLAFERKKADQEAESLTFQNLKDISTEKKEKAVYEDDNGNQIIPIFEESLSKAYLKEGYYKISYQDSDIILRKRAED